MRLSAGCCKPGIDCSKQTKAAAPDALCGCAQGVIEAGGVQWMTAGRGIVHSEMPKVTDGELWGFQLWINLPAKDKMVKPRYALPQPTASLCRAS